MCTCSSIRRGARLQGVGHRHPRPGERPHGQVLDRLRRGEQQGRHDHDRRQEGCTGSTWDGYYQTQEHNPKPTVSKMLFRASGTAAPDTTGHGFLIDNLTLTSS